MAGDYDGSEYIFLDNSYFGDGAVDDTSESLSTGRENKLNNNTRFLRREGSRVTYLWPNVYSWEADIAQRPFSAHNRTRYLWALWPVEPGLERVTFRLYASAHRPGTSSGDLHVWGAVYDHQSSALLPDGGVDNFYADGYVTYDDAQVWTVELDLSDTTIQGDMVDMIFGWYCQSVAATGTPGFHDNEALPQLSRWAVDPVDGGNVSYSKIAGDMETQDRKSLMRYLNSAGHGDLIPMSVESDSSKGEMSYFPMADRLSDAPAINIYDMIALAPTALHIEVEYDKDEAAGGYTPQAGSTMEPQEPVVGRHVSAHGRNLDEIRGRPVCRAIGPSGQTPEDTTSWGGERQMRWRWVLAKRGDTVLDQQMVQLAGANPSVSVYGYLACFIFKSDGQGEPGSESDIDQYSNTLDLHLKLEALDSPDVGAALASEVTVLPKTSYFLAARHAQYMLPNIVYWGTRNDQKDITHPYNETPAQVRATHQEGALMSSDRHLMLPFRATLDLSDVGQHYWRDKPLAMRLSIDDYKNEVRAPEMGSVASQDGITLCLQTAYFENMGLN